MNERFLSLVVENLNRFNHDDQYIYIYVHVNILLLRPCTDC
jgi:hypothetical protein